MEIDNFETHFVAGSLVLVLRMGSGLPRNVSGHLLHRAVTCAGQFHVGSRRHHGHLAGGSLGRCGVDEEAADSCRYHIRRNCDAQYCHVSLSFHWEKGRALTVMIDGSGR